MPSKSKLALIAAVAAMSNAASLHARSHQLRRLTEKNLLS
jgi:hypothetical protein